MKRKTILALLSPLLLAAPSQALFFIAGSEVMLNTAVAIEYDTNIFANANENDDFVARGSIGLSYARPYRFFDIGGSIDLAGTRHMDYTDNDRLNWAFTVFLTPTAEFGTRFWTLSTDIGFRRVTRADENIGRLITTDNYRGGLTLTITPTSRYFVEGGFLYSVIDPREGDLPEYHTLDTSFAAGWALGPRYFLLGQVTRRETDERGAVDTDNVVWNYSVGLRGQVSPRLTGQAMVGMARRKMEATGETDETPTFSLGLTFEVNRLMTATLTGARTFNTTLARNVQTTTNLDFRVNRTMRQNLTGTAFLGFVERDNAGIDTRRDRAYSAGANVNYGLAAWGNLTGGVTHTIQDSNTNFFDYSRTIVFLGLQASF